MMSSAMKELKVLDLVQASRARANLMYPLPPYHRCRVDKGTELLL